MFKWAKAAWQQIVTFHKTRLIFSLVDADREKIDSNFKVQFDDAKRASDFVGMVVRLTFLLFATIYLVRLAATEPWYSAVPISFAVTNCAILIVYLASKMSIIIFLFFATDAYPRESRRQRIFFLASSYVVMIVLFYSIWRIVQALAKHSLLAM